MNFDLIEERQNQYETRPAITQEGWTNYIFWSLKSLTVFLKPGGFFTYHQVEHSKILYGARFALSVLFESQNRQRLLFIHH